MLPLVFNVKIMGALQPTAKLGTVTIQRDHLTFLWLRVLFRLDQNESYKILGKNLRL